MIDPVRDGFLETTAEDAAAINAASDILRLLPQPSFAGAAHTYDGWLKNVEHLERAADRTVFVSSAEVGFTLDFPDDYCRSIDANLQFRVARVHFPLVHPNCRGGILCLGPHFRPGTRLRPLAERIYGIISGRLFATHHAFDADGCRYYLRHLEQVKSLRALPLWRRRVAGDVRAVDAVMAARVEHGDV